VKKHLMTLLALLTVVGAQAQDAWMIRTDAREGRKPGTTVALLTSELEVWAVNLPGFPLYEVGRTNYWKLGENTSVLAGGYVSYWPKSDQWFIEPWSLWRHTTGNTRLMGKLAAYAPLNGGPWYLYSDGVAATYQVTPTFDAGLAADWWLVSGQKPAAGIGAVANFSLGDHARLSLRALKGFNEPDTIRFELTLF